MDQPAEQTLVAQVAEQGAVPKLVKFSGALRDEAGNPLSGPTKLTFSVYKSKDDTTALWTETRSVTLDAEGHYTVLLGATKAEGIDSTIFASGEGRYVGVQFEGQAEITRTLMVSVPYALKAGDAEKLSGLSVSDFLLTKAAREKLASSSSDATSVAREAMQAQTETSGAVSSTSNTTGKIAKFTATDTVGDSVITEASGNIGIGTATPNEQLEITGNIRIPITTATTGIIFSGPNRLIHTFPFGSGNLFMGVNAGNLTTTSSNNLGVGNAALGGITSGSNNMALGGQAMSNLTTGVQNTAVGAQALFNNQANNNVGLGFNALVATTSGGGNTAVGTQAGQTNSTGTFNTAIGYNADVSSGTLTNATAIGANSRVNVSNALILGNGANVGIGTPAPALTTGGGLHIFNSSVAALKLASSGSSYEMFSINNGNFGLFDTTGGAYRLYITAAGNVGMGTTSPTSPLDVNGSNSTQAGKFTQTGAGTASFSVATPPPAAVRGDATAASNYVLGVLGTVSTPSGAGVVGMNLAATGNSAGAGIRGITTSSAAGTGVWGEATNTTGDNVGVYGTSASNSGTGVIGEATSTSAGGDTAGVYGLARNNAGVGVFGESVWNSTAQSSTLFPIGVWGRIQSTAGAAAVFDSANTSANLIVARSGSTTSPTNVFRVSGTGAVFGNGVFNTSGADFAESVEVAHEKSDYQPGDVIAIDTKGTRRFTKVSTPYSTLVAGIYSTRPGVLGSPYHIDDARRENGIPLAVVGIVPCKVTNENGAIKAGDLLVSSSTSGYAMKGTDHKKMNGAVIGKALQNMTGTTGVIEVLVSLQ